MKTAVEVHGIFKLIDNHISGFDEESSAALTLVVDPLGRTIRSVYRNNTFQSCTRVVAEGQKGLWDAANSRGNITIK